eukprot:8439783-Alexandrium_andersonii.AAC.1
MRGAKAPTSPAPSLRTPTSPGAWRRPSMLRSGSRVSWTCSTMSIRWRRAAPALRQRQTRALRAVVLGPP